MTVVDEEDITVGDEEQTVVDQEQTGCTARSVEDETRNGHRNAHRNPNRNHETTVLWLFSNFQVKRDLEQWLQDVQRVPWKTRLEMVVGMQIEILTGIMKLLFQVSFHLKI